MIWGATFAAVTVAYTVLAPIVDDYRSSLRAMTTDCRITRVVDGDTVDLRCAGRGNFRARVVGYDSPELFSPRCVAEQVAARRARDVLQTWALHASLTEVAFLGTDRWGRTLVDMRLSRQRVATAMVETGNGRRYFGRLRGGWC